jgi:hypothetical protein
VGGENQGSVAGSEVVRGSSRQLGWIARGDGGDGGDGALSPALKGLALSAEAQH